MIRLILRKIRSDVVTRSWLNSSTLSREFDPFRSIRKQASTDAAGHLIPWFAYPAIDCLDQIAFSNRYSRKGSQEHQLADTKGREDKSSHTYPTRCGLSSEEARGSKPGPRPVTIGGSARSKERRRPRAPRDATLHAHLAPSEGIYPRNPSSRSHNRQDFPVAEK